MKSFDKIPIYRFVAHVIVGARRAVTVCKKSCLSHIVTLARSQAVFIRKLRLYKAEVCSTAWGVPFLLLQERYQRTGMGRRWSLRLFKRFMFCYCLPRRRAALPMTPPGTLRVVVTALWSFLPRTTGAKNWNLINTSNQVLV